MGLQPARAENETMWFSICTKIANTAIANGYQDVGLRIFHEFSEQCCAKYDKKDTDAKFARAVRNYNPQWGFSILSNFLRQDNSDLLTQLTKEPALQCFFQEQQASKLEGKLQQFYLPDITSISKECNWKLQTCHEPHLEAIARRLLQAWSYGLSREQANLNCSGICMLLSRLSYEPPQSSIQGNCFFTESNDMCFQERHVERRS